VADIPQFALEGFEAARAAGLEQLGARHWTEIAHFRDIPLEVDWDAYAAFEAAGRLRTFTVRIDGQLVGYCLFILSHHPHYKSSLYAMQDVLFLAPEHRGAHIGAQLIRFCEERLRVEGVQVVTQHSKAKRELDLGPLLTRLGYELVDTVWAKRLDRESN
jgi:GNAT superfamily N-acetyltransferase